VITGQRHGERLGRLEDAFDGGRWDEEAERLAGEGRGQVIGFAGTAVLRGKEAEKQTEASAS
jgi:hypothetical protein